MTDKETGKAILVVCNFENENVISFEGAGKCILSNHEKRTEISGKYMPYECAVFEI